MVDALVLAEVLALVEAVRYSKGRIITYTGEKGIRKQERVNSLRC